MTPGRVLLAFVFLSQFASGLYYLLAVQDPFLFDGLSSIALVWLIWWWLRRDSRRFAVTWSLDLGMFLFYAWMLILPYHLFKTRGWSAFIPIFSFILVSLCGAVAAEIVAWAFR